MAVSSAQATEIARKAAAGIPLTNPTAETQKLYAAAQAASAKPAVSAAQQQEVIRKAEAGIALTNPNAATQAIYNQVVQQTNSPAAVSASIQQEVVRKAEAGIPLTNPTPATAAIYNATKAPGTPAATANVAVKNTAATTVSASASNKAVAAAAGVVTPEQQAEIARKAAAGIPLTNPTSVTQKIYDSLKQATSTVKQVVTGKATGGAAGTTPSASAKADREKQKQAYTGWDNDPAVRALQEKSWQIYIDTGRWDTPEQQQIHDQAEKARKYNNPMYEGLPNGPLDWMDAEKITPRDTTPNANTVEGALDSAMDTSKWGSYAAAGVGVLFLFMFMSMFRKR